MTIFIEYPVAAAVVGSIDLLVIYPVLLIGLLAAGISFLRRPPGSAGAVHPPG